MTAKSSNITVTIPDGFKETARAVAKARGKSISGLVVELFEREAAKEKAVRARQAG